MIHNKGKLLLRLVTLAALLAVALGVAPDQSPAAAQGVYTVSQANLDGTGGIALAVATLDTPVGIALDVAAGKMYVANHVNSTVSQANLDGTGGIALAVATLDTPVGIALDVAAGKMYVANMDTSTVSQANLDGTGGVSLGNLGGTLNQPVGIALDVAAGKMYVANLFPSPEIPEIDVQRPAGTSIADGGTDNVGNQAVGTVNLTYTIDNTAGTAQLDVTNVTASNYVNSSGFAVGTALPLNVAAGGTATLDVSFNVDAAGAFSLDMDIANNDADENPYDIAITGTGTTVGTIVIKKVTDPAGGTGFEFTNDVPGGPTPFNLDDGQSQTFNNVDVGSYTVTETDPAVTPGGYVLTNLACVETGTNNSTWDVGTRTVTTTLEAGETITCTFTNEADTDGDGVPDSVEGTGDRDGDGIPDNEDYDPTGYFYDETTGQIIPGGQIAVAGPGGVTMIHDGSSGYYAFTTDGTAGTYIIKVTLPPGYGWSNTCLRQDPPPFDPTGGANPTVLGNGENGATGFLTSSDCTPYYLTFDLAAGDPFIFNNNFPLSPPSPPIPVGGIVVPVNKLGLLAPWMGLAALASLATLTVALVRKRRA